MAEQITTAAELDALPVGSVVLAALPGAIAWQKVATDAGARWADANSVPGRLSGSLLARRGPMTVVHVPGRDPLAEAEARGARKALERFASGWLSDLASDLVDRHAVKHAARVLAAEYSARAEQAGGDRG